MNTLHDRRFALAVARHVSLAALAGALAACGATSMAPAAPATAASAAAVPYAPTPDADAFYQQPDPMPDVPVGTILNSRPVTFAPQALPLPNSAWQLQYMSRDVNNQPVAAIATVVKPLLPALSDPGPLVSYQYAEDSLGSQCAPSHSATGDTANYNNELEPFAYLTGLTALGWTLVIPDHEGPYSEYAAGKLAGQIVLDGIRAAESFAPLGLAGTSTPVGMWGYSGGAIATAWAASLQAQYAPELNIVGVASGGTPANIMDSLQAFNSGLGNLLFSLGLSAAIGATRAYPDALPESELNAKGQAAVAALENGCVGETSNGAATPTGHFADYVNIANPFATPGAEAAISSISLPQPGATPTVDLYIYQSELDELVPVAGVDGLVQSWCAAGAHINYYKGLTGEHITFDVTAAPTALLYLSSRFNGLPTVVPPGTQSCNE